MLKNTLFSLLFFPIGLFSQDCLFRVTLHENGKEIVINTNDVAYAVDVTPDTIVGTVARTVIAIRPNIQRYSVREPIDTIVANTCKTLALFTNNRTGKLTAISKSFVARAESNELNKTDILSKDTRVRFVSDELWEEIRDVLIDCEPLFPEIKELQFFRERFIESGPALVVKENGGLLPEDQDKISVFQNGQYIPPDFYVVSNDTILLSYIGAATDTFEVLFSYGVGSFVVVGEDFVGVTNRINVSGPLFVSDANVQVYQNGQLINPAYYSITESTIELAYIADTLDKFKVIVSVPLDYIPPGYVFRQWFNDVSDTIVITANSGIIPNSRYLLKVYQNGQLINMFAYTISGNAVVLEYPAVVGDIVEVFFPFQVGRFFVTDVHRELRTNITTAILSIAAIRQNKNYAQIYQNGLILQNEHYNILGSNINLTYTANLLDSFTIINQT